MEPGILYNHHDSRSDHYGLGGPGLDTHRARTRTGMTELRERARKGPNQRNVGVRAGVAVSSDRPNRSAARATDVVERVLIPDATTRPALLGVVEIFCGSYDVSWKGSARTVERHRANIMRKLGARSAHDLYRRVLCGILPVG